MQHTIYYSKKNYNYTIHIERKHDACAVESKLKTVWNFILDVQLMGKTTNQFVVLFSNIFLEVASLFV